MDDLAFLIESCKNHQALYDAAIDALNASRERLHELKRQRLEAVGAPDEVFLAPELDRQIADVVRGHNADALAAVRVSVEFEGLLRELRSRMGGKGPDLEPVFASLRATRATIEATHPHD